MVRSKAMMRDVASLGVRSVGGYLDEMVDDLAATLEEYGDDTYVRYDAASGCFILSVPTSSSVVQDA